MDIELLEKHENCAKWIRIMWTTLYIRIYIYMIEMVKGQYLVVYIAFFFKRLVLFISYKLFCLLLV